MSTFTVPTVRIKSVSEHSNADKLELLTIIGYICVVAKGIHTAGNLIVYVPEDSIVPDNVLEPIGLLGKLSGSDKNRVKAVRLRGVLSQGLVIPQNVVESILGREIVEGEDLAADLGITKWDPPVPVSLRGTARHRPSWVHKYTDVENIKRYPDVLPDFTDVIFTEKLHGACMSVSLHVDDLSDAHVCSRNIDLLYDENNSYWKAATEYKLVEVCKEILLKFNNKYVTIYGELLGVQDLKYGYIQNVGFRMFDVELDGAFVTYDSDVFKLVSSKVAIVPILYEGPLTSDAINEHTTGISTIASHIREGIVIRPRNEMVHESVGRVLLKSVSEAYLDRRDGTEYH